MVPARQRLLSERRWLGLAIFLATAALVWWRADAAGTFSLLGVADPWSDRLGPLLPSVCAGLSAMLLLSTADAAIGHIAGIVGALLLLVLPGFLPLHETSLLGPPLLVIVLLQLAVMLHAPRFSLAYGTVAAIAAVTVSSAAIGLPLAAGIWAMFKGGRDGTGSGSPRRAILSLVPLIAILLLAHWTGNEWVPEVPADGNQLQGGMGLAVSVWLDHLAPGGTSTTLRMAVALSMLVMMSGLLVMAWRMVAGRSPEGSVLHRLFPATGILSAAYATGLVARYLWSAGGGVPDLPAMMPLLAMALLMVAVSVAALWTYWPRMVRILLVGLAALWVAASQS